MFHFKNPKWNKFLSPIPIIIKSLPLHHGICKSNARVIPGYDHLWAAIDPKDGEDELTKLFIQWNDAEYLVDFFTDNRDDLERYFHITRIQDAVDDTFEDSDALEELLMDFPYTEELDQLFHALSLEDISMTQLTRRKARNWDRTKHASWLRIYAIRLQKNVYVITGGCIKLTAKMQDRPHTMKELQKLDACKHFLKSKGVFDQDSFISLIEEDDEK